MKISRIKSTTRLTFPPLSTLLPYLTPFPPTLAPLLLFLIAGAQFIPHAEARIVDVALNKPIWANVTCGILGAEEYLSHRFVYSSSTVREQNTQVCYNSSTLPVKHMVDGRDDTWWQSTSRTNFIAQGFGVLPTKPDSEIYIDLQQEFEVQQIRVLLGESLRPKQLIVYRSTSNLSDWSTLTPWVYLLTDEQNCTRQYGLPLRTTPVALTSRLCMAYSSPVQAMNEEIKFDFTRVAANLATWRHARLLKIEFYGIDLTLGYNGISFQHYAVRTINVMAECTCSGLALSCDLQPTTGTYECVCGGFTTGKTCNQCLSFYNQHPPQYGKPCEACNCNSHATSCFYNETVAKLNMSRDATGRKLGGGVCVNCTGNTRGVNCDLCPEYQYRPLGRRQNEANPCVPCICQGPGIKLMGRENRGDCLMNNDDPPPISGMLPGDCHCKANVVGPQCDRCKPGFFNLSSINPEGCLGCNCNPNGTIGGSSACSELLPGTIVTGSMIGQCACKKNVMGQQCTDCKEGFHSLNSTNPDGCQECSCNIGGAARTGCDKKTGQCMCRPGVTGAQCDTPIKGYYYPDLHFLSGEMENIKAPYATVATGYHGFGYVESQPMRPVSAVVTPPILSTFSSRYDILLRYQLNSVTTATGTVMVTSSDLLGGSKTYNVSLPMCAGRWCTARLAEAALSKGVAETITVTISSNTQVFLDKIILLPVEYLNATGLWGQSENSRFQQTCNVLDNDMKFRNESYCLEKVFALSSYYLNGALLCSCNGLGSWSADCAVSGGQCQCKPGVTGRQCDSCLLQYYGLDNLGCKACTCTQTAYRTCDSVTGKCLCPPGTEGNSCERCSALYYNWNFNTGCQPCSCDALGSANLACNTTTGTCQCRAGVTGAQCNQCLDGYWQLSRTGCSTCGCNIQGGGATSGLCDKSSGQCLCKRNVEEQKCSRCKLGSFSFSSTHSDGCLSCVCMGESKICSGAAFSPTQMTVDLFSTVSVLNTTTNRTEAIRRPTLHIRDAANPTQPSGLISVSRDISAGANQEAATMTLLTPGLNLYWVLPNFVGNMLNFYENTIRMTLDWMPLDNSILGISSGARMNARLLLLGRGTSSFQFKPAGNETVPHNVTSIVDFVLSVENLVNPVVGSTVSPGTREQLMLGLSDVRAVLLPASFFTRPHTSRLRKVEYHLVPQNVEECFCPTGYHGGSCEKCAVGFTRSNTTGHPYLGQCVPCQCNGHSQFCEERTGECTNCLRNTEGSKCERCKLGHYRDNATDVTMACKKCPCDAPRAATPQCVYNNSIVRCLNCSEGYTGNTCETCLPFHWRSGNTCVKCNCSGNSATCDPLTGRCIGCANNTQGFNCESCISNWFGNPIRLVNGSLATNYSICSACACNMTGSSGITCQSVTGQCQCLPGASGRACDRCLPEYYGFSRRPFFGCVKCECNTIGSASTQCDETGKCVCKPNTIGLKCDQCASSFYGLPAKPCEACSCDSIGTTLLTKPCNTVTGQCECKPGVGGRRCSECLPMYANLSINGCSRCGDCQSSLFNDTVRLRDLYKTYWNQSSEVLQLQGQGSRLAAVESSLVSAYQRMRPNSTSNSTQQDVATLKAILKGLVDKENFYATTLLSTGYMVNQTEINSAVVEAEAQDILSRLQTHRDSSTSVREFLGKELSTVLTSMSTLRAHSSTASRLLQGILQASDPTIPTSTQPGSSGVQWNMTYFTEVNRLVREENAKALVAFNVAKQQLDNVNIQLNTTMGFQAILTQIEKNITSISQADLSSRTVSLRASLSALSNSINRTEANRQSALNFYNESLALLERSRVLLANQKSQMTTSNQMLRDITTVLSGVTNGRLPINTTADLSEITGWNSSYNLVSQRLQAAAVSLSSTSNSVSQADQKTNELTNLAQTIANTFAAVSPRGQAAVTAIDGYEGVAKALDASIARSRETDVIIQQTDTLLRSNTPQQLEARAAQALNSSLALRTEAQNLNRDLTMADYNTRIVQANASLQTVAQQWKSLDTKYAAYTSTIQNLGTITLNSSTQQLLGASNAVSQSALQVANDVITREQALRTRVDAQARSVATVVSNASTSTQLMATLNNDILSIRTQMVNVIQPSIQRARVDQQSVQIVQPDLEKRLQALTTKILEAQKKLVAFEQPVSLTGLNGSYETIPNPDGVVSKYFHSVGLDFMYTQRPTGVLYFAENNSTREKILLQLLNSSVVFQLSNSDTTVTAVSPAVLLPGTWYRVYATRYDLDGQLTVQRLSTSGLAVTDIRLESTVNKLLTLNSPLYIGGVPPGYPNRNKLLDGGGSFGGCVYNVHYSDIALPLWQTVLRKDSTATCCRKPTPNPPGPTLQGSVTLHGFGYVNYSPGSLSVADSGALITLEMRTYSSEGVILVVSSPTSTDHYGLYMRAGRIIFSIRSPAAVVELQTLGTFNSGLWTQITAMHNRTFARLMVQYTPDSFNGTQPPPVDVRSTVTSDLNLGSLAGLGFTMGGQNPNATSRGPVSLGLSGCIRRLMHHQPRSLVVIGATVTMNFDLTAGIASSLNSELNKCYVSVVPGLGLRGGDSYAVAQWPSTAVGQLDMEIIATRPSGILLYTQLFSGPTTTGLFLYVALYNGDVLIVFNQGSGVQPAFRSRGLYLSDGLKHRIQLDFSYTNSPRLTVDSAETHVGATPMSPFMSITGGGVYLGGVPSNIGLDPTLIPVRTSLQEGAILSLKINSGSVDFYNPAIVQERLVKSIYLSGIPAPPTAPPPLPYTTTLPPPTIAPPRCVAPPTTVSYLDNSTTTQFGLNGAESYQAYNSTGLKPVFINAFAVRMRFRALQSTGMLLYLASSPLPNPAHFFAIYMDRGQLKVSLSTSSRPRNGTKTVTSRLTYDDGRWSELEVLRINDFLAVIVSDDKDYVNNQQHSVEASILDVATPVYVGGVPRTITGLPFNAPDIPIGNRPFVGCISNFYVTTYQFETILFGKEKLVDSKGLGPCASQATPGLYLNSSTAYVRLTDSFSISPPLFSLVPGFTVSVTYRSTSQNGTIFVAWRSSTSLAVIQLVNGQLQVLVGTATGAAPFVGRSGAMVGPFSVCDGQSHTVQMSINTDSVALLVDGSKQENLAVSSSIYPPPTGVPIYLGGVRDPSWRIPGIFEATSLKGCVQSASINNQRYFITESSETSGASLGCPG